MANQYDPLVIKSGLAGVLGTDTLRADVIAHAGLTTTGLAAGDVVQVTANLTLSKAVNTSTSPIVGVYDGVTGSVVREGIVVATFKTAPTANGDAVYLSDAAGKLTTTKPTKDMLHEVGVVVDFANRKILLQQKPVIALIPTPPTMVWVGGNGYVSKWLASSGANQGIYAVAVNGPINSMAFNGTNIMVWVGQNGYQKAAYISQTGTVLSGPATNPPQGNSYGIAWDGTYFWFGDGSTNLRQYNTSFVAQYTSGLPGLSVVYDGQGNIWCQRTGNAGHIYKINASTKVSSGPWYPSSWYYYGSDAWWLCTDGTYVYSCGQNGGYTGLCLTKIKISDGTQSNYTPYATGNTYHSMCTDGTYLYIWVGSEIIKVRCSDGAYIATGAAGSNDVCQLCCDGTYLWLPREGSNYLRKVRCSDLALIGDYGSGDWNQLHGPKCAITTPNIMPALPG